MTKPAILVSGAVGFVGDVLCKENNVDIYGRLSGIKGARPIKQVVHGQLSGVVMWRSFSRPAESVKVDVAFKSSAL